MFMNTLIMILQQGFLIMLTLQTPSTSHIGFNVRTAGTRPVSSSSQEEGFPFNASVHAQNAFKVPELAQNGVAPEQAGNDPHLHMPVVLSHVSDAEPMSHLWFKHAPVVIIE